jgi:hypothetical protein
MVEDPYGYRYQYRYQDPVHGCGYGLTQRCLDRFPAHGCGYKATFGVISASSTWRPGLARPWLTPLAGWADRKLVPNDIAQAESLAVWDQFHEAREPVGVVNQNSARRWVQPWGRRSRCVDQPVAGPAGVTVTGSRQTSHGARLVSSGPSALGA